MGIEFAALTMAASALLASAALADDPALPPLACEGSDPAWYLDVLGPVARLRGDRELAFETVSVSSAEGTARDWPRLVLLRADNGALHHAVLDETACQTAYGSFPLSVQYLDLSARTPLLLTGCCAVAE